MNSNRTVSEDQQNNRDCKTDLSTATKGLDGEKIMKCTRLLAYMTTSTSFGTSEQKIASKYPSYPAYAEYQNIWHSEAPFFPSPSSSLRSWGTPALTKSRKNLSSMNPDQCRKPHNPHWEHGWNYRLCPNNYRTQLQQLRAMHLQLLLLMLWCRQVNKPHQWFLGPTAEALGANTWSFHIRLSSRIHWDPLAHAGPCLSSQTFLSPQLTTLIFQLAASRLQPTIWDQNLEHQLYGSTSVSVILRRWKHHQAGPIFEGPQCPHAPRIESSESALAQCLSR